MPPEAWGTDQNKRGNYMYELEDFCSDVKTALLTLDGAVRLARYPQKARKLLTNEEFVSTYCHKDAKIGVHVLYQDDELGFMVLNHVINKGRKSPPHDHGNPGQFMAKPWGIRI